MVTRSWHPQGLLRFRSQPLCRQGEYKRLSQFFFTAPAFFMQYSSLGELTRLSRCCHDWTLDYGWTTRHRCSENESHLTRRNWTNCALGFLSANANEIIGVRGQRTHGKEVVSQMTGDTRRGRERVKVAEGDREGQGEK